MSLFIRTFAWLLAAAVTFATLGPPGLRPHSTLGQDGEHALAFIMVGLAFGLAYPRRRLLIAAAAVILIGVLELMQFWAPGRHARLEDYLVDAATACLGFALAATADRLLSRFCISSAVASEGPAE
ncbi:MULTISPECIES: VanZ family protein [Bradyrhizobium]|uniref:VanZ family protein n=1 Tax=Bradyrhizobium TaxID=374 RepID=UPI00155F2DD6|nr:MULTISPECIES: VanZ family protein [Bradyrhizobium]MDD1517772.1 VanZ family protein [Bradyrhizobium sp. WBAH30]MDD1540883.1 VanZ family protein [Bradyrhizobium sp. WBAH41]MDD1555673.1 VanZ family protein [Bradyrhizobium sp. WBAH23]MDD1563518.1 VanZ family protein [Bradyrhizobium sp. WBAH33]MDD1587981.1 VanZ family protein [Bradyrhizobium sp. WBAH42]